MRFLFAGGGTGGHLVPGLALADALCEHDPKAEILFVGTHHGLDAEMVPAAGYKLKQIAAGRGSPLNLRAPLNLPRFLLALVQSQMLLRRFAPDAVIALGGFAAAAPGLIAALWHTPLFVLEQNTVPGRVTRLLARWAAEIHVQFDEARPLLKTSAPIHHSGSPIRSAMLSCQGTNTNARDALLILGGSQGAQRLNDVVLQAAPQLLDTLSCRIIHIAGAANEQAVRTAYKKKGLIADVLGFTNEMPNLLGQARVAISRAGAMSLAELAVAGVPPVLVPLPEAKDDHQRKNAVSIADDGGAVVLEQETLTSALLEKAVFDLWNVEDRYNAMRTAISATAKPNAAADIAKSILRNLRETTQ